MKKWIGTAVLAAFLAAAAASPARAGDREWATAGKILTGIIGVSILGNAIANAHPYPQPVYVPPPRAYYPPERVWIPGHSEVRVQRRWVPGHWEVERGRGGYDRYGNWYDGRGRRIWVPGHYRDVEVRVWVPGHWEHRG